MWCRKKLNPSYKKPNKRRKSGAEKIKLIMKNQMEGENVVPKKIKYILKKSNTRRKCGAEKKIKFLMKYQIKLKLE